MQDEEKTEEREREHEEQQAQVVQCGGCSAEDGAANVPELSVSPVQRAVVARLRRGSMLVSKCRAEDDAPAAYDSAALLESATAMQHC